jgi:hypothetical protein
MPSATEGWGRCLTGGEAAYPGEPRFIFRPST